MSEQFSVNCANNKCTDGCTLKNCVCQCHNVKSLELTEPGSENPPGPRPRKLNGTISVPCSVGKCSRCNQEKCTCECHTTRPDQEPETTIPTEETEAPDNDEVKTVPTVPTSDGPSPDETETEEEIRITHEKATVFIRFTYQPEAYESVQAGASNTYEINGLPIDPNVRKSMISTTRGFAYQALMEGVKAFRKAKREMV